MKLPPYGKEIKEIISLGLRPSKPLHLYIGRNAWNEGAEGHLIEPHRTLVLPAWETPAAFFWPVSKCKVLIIDTGFSDFADEDYIEELVYSLYKHGSSIVWAWTPEAKDIIFFEKDC